MDLPLPTIKRRKLNKKRFNDALTAGLDPIVAQIIAARPFLEEISPKELLTPPLKVLDNPGLLPDIEQSVLRLIQALTQQEVIGIETDHDCDGQTSHAVLFTALTDIFGHPKEKVRSYIGHRLKEGYGLSESVAKRILEDEPPCTLIITADNGSSDEERIALLKAAGIDVIVTDHHEIPAMGIPQSAYAVINPIRSDSYYPDKCIAGCMVAWLFMAATRQKLLQTTKSSLPSLVTLLDFVAVGTIADCVSIARSRNNRAIVNYGMKLIQQALRPCWRVLLPLLSSPISSEDLGFKIGPLLNSDGRLSCAFGSVSFLLAENDEEAMHWIEHLQLQNTERKAIQDRVTKAALLQAKMQFKGGKKSLCLFLEEGHAGVHGICASRIKDLFGRPVIIFCPKSDSPQFLTGSARAIEGIHLRNVLQIIYERNSELIIRFGGHSGAAGLTIARYAFDLFSLAFEEVVNEHIQDKMIGPIILSDGELALDKITIPFISKLYAQLEPFGREFEPPLFEATGKVLSIQGMGQTQTHAKVSLVIDEIWFEAVWFNCKERSDLPWPVNVGDIIQVIFSPKLQTFRGQKKLSCQIIYAQRRNSSPC